MAGFIAVIGAAAVAKALVDMVAGFIVGQLNGSGGVGGPDDFAVLDFKFGLAAVCVVDFPRCVVRKIVLVYVIGGYQGVVGQKIFQGRKMKVLRKFRY